MHLSCIKRPFQIFTKRKEPTSKRYIKTGIKTRNIKKRHADFSLFWCKLWMKIKFNSIWNVFLVMAEHDPNHICTSIKYCSQLSIVWSVKSIHIQYIYSLHLVHHGHCNFCNGDNLTKSYAFYHNFLVRPWYMFNTMFAWYNMVHFAVQTKLLIERKEREIRSIMRMREWCSPSYFKAMTANVAMYKYCWASAFYRLAQTELCK